MVIYHNYVSLPEGTNLGCINHGSDSWGNFSTWRTTSVFLAAFRGWLLALVMCAILPFMGVGAALMGKAPKKKLFWLVVWNIWIIFHFIYGLSSETHWRTHIFQDVYCTTNQLLYCGRTGYIWLCFCLDWTTIFSSKNNNFSGWTTILLYET